MKGPSHSTGPIGAGKLVDGVALTDFPPYHQVLRQQAHKHNWTHSGTAVYLDQLAQRTHAVTGHGLIIGEMSGRHGGHIGGHQTHTNGASVDIYFKALPKAGLGIKERETNVGKLQTSLLKMSLPQRHEAFKTMALAFDDPRVRDGYLNPALLPQYRQWTQSKEAKSWAAQHDVKLRTDNIGPVRGHDFHFHVNLYNPDPTQVHARPEAYDAAALAKKYGPPADKKRMAGFIGQDAFARLAAAHGWNPPVTVAGRTPPSAPSQSVPPLPGSPAAPASTNVKPAPAPASDSYLGRIAKAVGAALYSAGESQLAVSEAYNPTQKKVSTAFDVPPRTAKEQAAPQPQPVSAPAPQNPRPKLFITLPKKAAATL